MEIKEAIEILKDHNVWRKGEDDNAIMTNPKKLGIAIDTVVNEFENLFISIFVVPKGRLCVSGLEKNKGEECINPKMCKKFGCNR